MEIINGEHIIYVGFTGWYTYQQTQYCEGLCDRLIYRPLKKSRELQQMNVTIRKADCQKTECDIVFKSVYELPWNVHILGNPLIILYSGESMLPGQFWDITKYKFDYSLTFFNDSSTNLYYPIWQDIYRIYYKYLHNETLYAPSYAKKEFCTFIVKNQNNGDLTRERIEFAEYVSKNYKPITYAGAYNTTINNPLPYDTDVCKDFHLPYKFNICFENRVSPSSSNQAYITEKIMNAYIYGVIPIYKGAEDIVKYFNPKSFINANGKTHEQVLNEIIELDNDDVAYNAMRNECPFNADINWYDSMINRYTDFMVGIIKKHFLGMPRNFHYAYNPFTHKYDIDEIHAFFDKVYCINMPSNRIRREHMKAYNETLGLDIEFYAAVNFAEFFEYDKQAYLKFILKYGGYNNWKNASAQFGIMFSHYHVIKSAYDLGYSRILVMEDDLCFTKNKKLFYEYLNRMPDGWDVIKWEQYFPDNIFVNGNLKAIKDIFNSSDYYTDVKELSKYTNGNLTGAGCVAYSRRAMKAFIDYIEDVDTIKIADTAKGIYSDIQNSKLNMYMPNKVLVFQQKCIQENDPTIWHTTIPLEFSKDDFYIDDGIEAGTDYK